jgi:hypothetical protein
LALRAAVQGWSVRTLEAEIARVPSGRRPEPHPDHAASATVLGEPIATAIGADADARPYRGGYRVFLDRVGAERLAALLRDQNGERAW